jgi:predicted ATP-grasp superfamily ATP-dependent carboligase
MKRILITCIGGYFSYQVVSSIKKVKNLSKFVLGVDVNPNVNAFFVDKFEIVPRADLSQKKYITKIIYLCKKYKIDTLIPSSENETLAISKYINLFKNNKIKIPVSSFDTVNLMTDKLKMFEYLNYSGVDVGKWKKVDNFSDAANALNFFGYPSKKVIIKPRFSSGSRGILIANHKKNSFTNLLGDRLCGEGPWEAIKEELKNSNRSLDNYFVMPFHEGKTFDVDCIAKEGNLVMAVSRLRVYENPLSPTNQGCIIGPNKTIYNYCVKLVKAFKIYGACDFDIVIRKDSRPQLLDSSCRLSGSVGASLNAGVNVVAELIKMLHGKKPKKIKLLKNVKVFPTPIFVKSL